MSGTDVVVVGAVNVDMVVTAPRLPGPGETVVGPGVERYGGGKGANAAVAAARAGGRVHYVGAVGDDDLGRGAVAELRNEGVDATGVAVSDTATGVALIVVNPDGENQIAVGAGANTRVDPPAVESALRRTLPRAGCVLVSTEIPGEAVDAAVRTARIAGARCILNPAPVLPSLVDLLELGPLLTPNAGELLDLATAAGVDHGAGGAGPRSSATVLRCARALSGLTKAELAVTLGGDGVLIVWPDGAVEHLQPHPVTVRDTTGAGDTFNGILALELARGEPLAAAARTANVAAALSVAGEGARGGMPSMHELAHALVAH
ncbi:PfkB family carbohydrate kinase [Pseudonocardia halophobica]|uniref:PfkB family carbohydrate kinase n=1 Tax=Pseudonocardia halophobica TaxID=29401 RepID=UPI003D8F731F